MEYYKNLSLELLSVVIDGIYYLEEWRDIPGFEGHYQVSSFGRVKSLKGGKEKILTQAVDNWGYLRIGLRGNGKNNRFKMSRLVMWVFNGESPLQVDHKVEVKTYNCVWNLQYLDNRANVSKNYKKRGRIKDLPTGVKAQNGRFAARIVVDGRQRHLGVFDTPEEASSRYELALGDIENIHLYEVKRTLKYGDPGVRIHQGKFIAKLDGKQVGGRYDTPQEAVQILREHRENQKSSQEISIIAQ